jgi:uncharacterized protein DUF4340
MKKNTLYLILFLVLATAAILMIQNNKNSTLDHEVSDFSVKDTGSIVKIFLADKEGNEVTLTKVDVDKWLVNNDQEARPDGINNLLTTINMVDIRSPVARAARDNVLKRLASVGKKIEIYNKDGLIKTYYVGGPTQDQLGTFMFLENTENPFVTQIPGFEGYLTTRYITSPDEWLTKRVFNLKPFDILKVKASDYSQPGYNVWIEQNSDHTFSLYNGAGEAIDQAGQDKIINYLNVYAVINYELTEHTLSKSQIDSLLVSEPFRELSLLTVQNDTTHIEFWRRPVTESTTHKTNPAGEIFPFDVDRMVARVNNSATLLVVQYFTFDKLFKKPEDFVIRLN